MRAVGARSVRLLTVAALLAAVLTGVAAPALAGWNVPEPGSSVAHTGDMLRPGDQLTSPDGRFRLVQQTDGNLVLYAPEGALWASRTVGTVNTTYLQPDGNLVVRRATGTWAWQSHTAGAGAGVRLAMQSNGNLVLYSGTRQLWSTATTRRPTPPLGYSGTATQAVSVAAPTAGSTTATLSGWTRTPSGWVAAIAATTAFVGSAGVGAGSEAVSRTPAGTFTLTQAFGRNANPGTALPWFTTDTLDWWDENPSSPTYNLHVRRSTSPGGNSENLYRAGAVYDAAVVIDYNTARTPGAGSGIFLHVTNGAPTAGCVAVPLARVVAILRWLAPGAHPVIRIGVG